MIAHKEAHKKALYSTVFIFILAMVVSFFVSAVLLIPGALVAWSIGWPVTIFTAFAMDIAAVLPVSMVLAVIVLSFRKAYLENLSIAMLEEKDQHIA